MDKIEIYRDKEKNIEIEVKLDEETVWLSLNQISNLFNKDKSVISRHLSNIYKQKELDRKSTVAKNATVQTEGNRKINRIVEYYNLDAIISVGYRVNSKRGIQFRTAPVFSCLLYIIRPLTKKNCIRPLQKRVLCFFIW